MESGMETKMHLLPPSTVFSYRRLPIFLRGGLKKIGHGNLDLIDLGFKNYLKTNYKFKNLKVIAIVDSHVIQSGLCVNISSFSA